MPESVIHFFAVNMDRGVAFINIWEVINNLQPEALSTRYIIFGVSMISAGVLLALISLIVGRIISAKRNKIESDAPAYTTERQVIIPEQKYITEEFATIPDDGADVEETILLDEAEEETSLIDDDVEETELLDSSSGMIR